MHTEPWCADMYRPLSDLSGGDDLVVADLVLIWDLEEVESEVEDGYWKVRRDSVYLGTMGVEEITVELMEGRVIWELERPFGDGLQYDLKISRINLDREQRASFPIS